jgi:DNA-binding beta-propeller fold protein YncE
MRSRLPSFLIIGETIMFRKSLAALSVTLVSITATPAGSEILAMMNYETKTADSLKALKLGGDQPREEGIAVMDVDPKSPAFGRILMKIPLPTDLVAHHIFYDRTMTKAYITALGKPELRVMDMTRYPYRIKVIDIPSCKFGEDVVFSEDNKTWYLTCMGSDTVVVGETATDTVNAEFKTEKSNPHGLAVHSGIDRVLVTNTIRPDLTEPGEFVSVVKASTNKLLEPVRVATKPSPSGVAPVEVLFVPRSDPPIAYVTNMFGHSLWGMKWNAGTDAFDASEIFSFETVKQGVPLEMYFNSKADRLYVTTAKPGAMHIFDISADPLNPALLKSLPAGEGAHHVAITRDEKLAFVQNALLNLPGMSDGTITVIDLESEKVIATIDTLKEQGLNANSIVLLPEWNHLAGH